MCCFFSQMFLCFFIFLSGSCVECVPFVCSICIWWYFRCRNRPNQCRLFELFSARFNPLPLCCLSRMPLMLMVLAQSWFLLCVVFPVDLIGDFRVYSLSTVFHTWFPRFFRICATIFIVRIFNWNWILYLFGSIDPSSPSVSISRLMRLFLELLPHFYEFSLCCRNKSRVL